ncbi:hypothetical protein Droror1_Dr00018262 [Drosera rotundifolia]
MTLPTPIFLSASISSSLLSLPMALDAPSPLSFALLIIALRPNPLPLVPPPSPLPPRSASFSTVSSITPPPLSSPHCFNGMPSFEPPLGLSSAIVNLGIFTSSNSPLVTAALSSAAPSLLPQSSGPCSEEWRLFVKQREARDDMEKENAGVVREGGRVKPGEAPIPVGARSFEPPLGLSSAIVNLGIFTSSNSPLVTAALSSAAPSLLPQSSGPCSEEWRLFVKQREARDDMEKENAGVVREGGRAVVNLGIFTSSHSPLVTAALSSAAPSLLPQSSGPCSEEWRQFVKQREARDDMEKENAGVVREGGRGVGRRLVVD